MTVGELNRVLSTRAILLITINSIMGTGIFFLPALGAAKAGPASIISWLILSFVSIYVSMCFAELTGMFPNAGGVYEFCKQAFGHFWSFMIGWITVIAGNITIAMLIVGAIRYINPNSVVFFALDLGFVTVTISFNILICLGFILIFNYIAYKGMDTSAFMLITFALITLITLFALIIPGIFNFNPDNLKPFFTHPPSVIFLTIFFIAETFFGWETATFLAGETKDGDKVMPKVLIWSTVIIAVICLLFVVTSLGVIPAHLFGASATPLTDLAMVHYGEAGINIFKIMVYLSIIGSVAGWIISAPRLLYAMAEDKLFVPAAAKIHPTNKSPYNAILFQTIFTCILILFASGSYEALLKMLVPLVLIMYSAVVYSLVVLRKKKPNHPRTYWAPFKYGPHALIAFLLSLLVMWPILEGHEALALIKLGFSLIFFGVPIFLLLITYYDPDIIIKLNDMFAYLNLTFERMLLPKKVIRNIDDHLGDVNGKRILEFGCGVGSLTKELAKKVGDSGEIYATDISYNSVKIARRRMEKRGHSNISFVHDIHQVNRVHDSIPRVDVVVSFGMLGYIQDIDKVLRDIKRLLPESGRIIFVDFVDLFKLIPNVNWLSHEDKLREVFRKNGFSVQVSKVSSPFWNYLIVSGIKSDDPDLPFI